MIQPSLPPWIVLDPCLEQWLREDIGRGDRATQAICQLSDTEGLGSQRDISQAQWLAKAEGTIAGLPLAARLFTLLDAQATFQPQVSEGAKCQSGQVIAHLDGPLAALLMGERVALNLAMRLSGIATLTRQYVEGIADFSTQLVDTRKTTPGLRLLEKYAMQVGGAVNHRLGLDDALMLKDNHIQAAGDIVIAVQAARATMPYPLTLEVETETLAQVQAAIAAQVDIIMLDNMSIDAMTTAVKLIRSSPWPIIIEASGNVTLDTLAAIARTGVDYISTSAPITRAPWLDLSMKLVT